jgi:RNA polymerase sigma-70 factor (ECF subfamily)
VLDWPQVVDEHGAAAYRIARRILGHATDAEDVCQEVFSEVHRLSTAKTIVNLPGLVRRLAALRAVDCLRARKQVLPLDDSAVARDTQSPPAVAIANELAVRLRGALAQLPPQQAAAFALRYFENLNNTEIAESLETSASAVSTALSKARDTLAELLGIANPRS